MAGLPPLSPALKSLQPYIRTALEHDQRDPVIAYWCRIYALQTGLTIDRKSKESITFLTACMDYLEKTKNAQQDNEAISSEVVAQAHVENYALKMFFWADAEDRAGRFNKNVIKAFYTAGIVFEILTTFGELTEEIQRQKKYAKWKATYIHNCLKSGITPKAGPEANEEDGEDYNFTAPTVPGGNPYADGPSSSASGYLPYPPDVNTVGAPTIPHQDPPSLSTLSVSVPGAHAPPSTPSGSNQPSPSSSRATYDVETSNGSALSAEEIQKAQKYCKWAGSALQYEDIPTAIDNLQKALMLLTTGKDTI